MREDQYLKLQALEEKVTDQFLFEADPTNWTGDGIAPAAMTQDQRGDRYWCKKNAVATISLAIRIGTLIGKIQLAGGTTPPAEGGAEGGDPSGEGLLDAEVNAAEKEAKRLLRQFERKQKAASA